MSDAYRPPTDDTPHETDSWEAIAEKRDLLEEIVAKDLPYAPHAEDLLAELDRRGL